jgi:hypothetical protein
MEFLNNGWFWFAMIIIAGIIYTTIERVTSSSNKTKRYIAEVQSGGPYKKVADDAAALNAQVLAKLDDMEKRLAVIEKTLTDIP